MIISKVIGGLGNQLFQYAVGRTLAILNNTNLKLDASEFENQNLRNIELQNFTIDPVFANKDEINELIPAHNFEKAFQYMYPLKGRTYYREKHFHFDEKVLRLGANVYLKGYFQSEKYFRPAKEIIREELSFKEAKIKNIKEFAAKLSNHQSISVHIRRGDFHKDKSTSEYHGVLTDDYYLSAIEIIRSKISDPSFYFLSDDIKWVKENLAIPEAIYVSGEITKNHIEDLYLMSQCRHNIIANSSFSWWGAWLNDNPGKIVIAPEKWFNKGPKDTQDLLPEGWTKI